MSDSKITELHSAYCDASGFDLPLRMGRDRAWFDFEKAGFTKEDLLLTIRWIKKQFGKGGGYGPSSLRFSTLLQLDYFEEKLLLARQAFGRSKAKPATKMAEQRVGDIRRQIEVNGSSELGNAGEVAAKQLREWRQKMKQQAEELK